MIYFLKANDKIKIGYADDPSKRIPSIQTSSPFELEVLLIIDGNYDKERELHKKFQKHRTQGEWFDLEGPIQTFIKENLEFDRKYEFGLVPKKKRDINYKRGKISFQNVHWNYFNILCAHNKLLPPTAFFITA